MGSDCRLPTSDTPLLHSPPLPSTLRHELARKALHVSTAVVPAAYMAGVPRDVVLGALGALLAVALLVEIARARHGWARSTFTRATGALLREHEHARWAGATWLLLAFLLAVALFPAPVAAAAMLGVAFGDAAGAIVGRWWSARRSCDATPDRSPAPSIEAPPTGAPRSRDARGGVLTRHHAAAPGGGKTLAGSLACAVATTVGALLVARLDIAQSLLAGGLAALAERPRSAVDDNLRVVLAVGTGILLWRMAFS